MKASVTVTSTFIDGSVSTITLGADNWAAHGVERAVEAAYGEFDARDYNVNSLVRMEIVWEAGSPDALG